MGLNVIWSFSGYNKIEDDLRKNMKQRITLDDGFQEDDYDLTDYYLYTDQLRYIINTRFKYY